MPIHSAPLVAGLIPSGEAVLMSARPSAWFIVLSRLGLIVWMVSMTGLLLVLRRLAGLGESLVATLVWGAVAGVSLVLLYGVMDWFTRAYVLTLRRVISVSGIFRQTAVEIPLSMVQNTVVHKRLRERVLGLGTLVFVSANDGLGAVVWPYSSSPERQLSLCRDALEHARREH